VESGKGGKYGVGGGGREWVGGGGVCGSQGETRPKKLGGGQLAHSERIKGRSLPLKRLATSPSPRASREGTCDPGRKFIVSL